jgi:hypothetical protein
MQVIFKKLVNLRYLSLQILVRWLNLTIFIIKFKNILKKFNIFFILFKIFYLLLEICKFDIFLYNLGNLIIKC